MSSRDIPRGFITALAKHLPPSASTLRLLDMDNAAGAVLSELRPEIIPQTWSEQADADSADAVTGIDIELSSAWLTQTLSALRPGGRLIAILTDKTMDDGVVIGRRLEQVGFTRILVEAALDDPPRGLLVRGEKPHTNADTLARVNAAAARDTADVRLETTELAHYGGRYLFLLIRQTPDKPAWALAEGETVTLRAITTSDDTGRLGLLAFSSLPKAVAFMQRAVLAGEIAGVNKIAKFRRERLLGQTNAAWWWINPPAEAALGTKRRWDDMPINPALAEAGGE